MIRRTAIASGLALLVAALPVQAADATGPHAGSSAECTWKWKKKRVVKFVKRDGKKTKVVRYRKRRVCVPVVPAAPARLGVKAFEWGFTLSRTSLAAGDTVVELSNRGEDEHNLHIQKVTGGTETVIPDTMPSTYQRVRFHTQPGTYRLWCSLPAHAERGMDTTIDVNG